MILLDTCVLIWLESDRRAISSAARRRIEDGSQALFASSISAFEIALKQKKRKLVLRRPAEEWFDHLLRNQSIADVPIDWRIAELAARLPLPHGDPADRIIAATAIARGLTLLTPDPLLSSLQGLNVEW